MVEKKEGVYNIGHTRMKYLDFANMSFAQGNLLQCKSYIDSFIDTVDDKSDAGKSLRKDFDMFYKNKRELESAVETKVKDMGYLEKKDYEDMVRRELEFETIHNIKETCWRISLEYGLFFE